MNKPEKNFSRQKENKNARINIRLTTKEKELLQTKAQASKMSVGRFLITAGLNPKSIKVVPEINKSLYLELCRQGNNLNQLTRLQNTISASGKKAEIDADDRAMLENLGRLINQVLTELAKGNAN